MREVSIDYLCDKVNSYALETIEELTKTHPGVKFLFTAINSYADNLPEVSTVLSEMTNDDVYKLDLEYTDLLISIGQMHGIDIYVENKLYDGMNMVPKHIIDPVYLNGSVYRFYAMDKKFYED